MVRGEPQFLLGGRLPPLAAAAVRCGPSGAAGAAYGGLIFTLVLRRCLCSPFSPECRADAPPPVRSETKDSGLGPGRRGRGGGRRGGDAGAERDKAAIAAKEEAQVAVSGRGWAQRAWWSSRAEGTRLSSNKSFVVAFVSARQRSANASCRCSLADCRILVPRYWVAASPNPLVSRSSSL